MSLIVQYSSMPLVVTAVMKQGEETVAMANTLEIASAPFRMLFLNFLQRQTQHIGNVIACCVITLIAPFFPPRHPPPHPPPVSVGFCFPRQPRHLSGLSPSAPLKVPLSLIPARFIWAVMTAELLSPRFQAAPFRGDQWGASGRVIDAGGAGGSGTARRGETVEVA